MVNWNKYLVKIVVFEDQQKYNFNSVYFNSLIPQIGKYPILFTSSLLQRQQPVKSQLLYFLGQGQAPF